MSLMERTSRAIDTAQRTLGQITERGWWVIRAVLLVLRGAGIALFVSGMVRAADSINTGPAATGSVGGDIAVGVLVGLTAGVSVIIFACGAAACCVPLLPDRATRAEWRRR